jgi:hypothetical protein
MSEYVRECLRQDEEFILYRARASAAEPSSVLLLTPASIHPRPESLKKIEHEYSLCGDFDTTWAVRPLALGTGSRDADPSDPRQERSIGCRIWIGGVQRSATRHGRHDVMLTLGANRPITDGVSPDVSRISGGGHTTEGHSTKRSKRNYSPSQLDSMSRAGVREPVATQRFRTVVHPAFLKVRL